MKIKRAKKSAAEARSPERQKGSGAKPAAKAAGGPKRHRASQALPSAGVTRIAGLVIVNAMIFQEVLASHDDRVRSIRALLREVSIGGVANAFVSHWDFIIENIDYFPIFRLASDLLAELPADEQIEDALRDMSVTAQSIVGRKAALRQDLMGRIFHKMLLEAKYLGTYYTSIPAATMLLRTAMRPDAWPTIDWANLNELRDFKVADLACGTGTLLMAAADAISDNSLRAYFAKGDENKPLPQHNKDVHRAMAEDILHGYDVLPTALHLTAATLAMRAPDVAFERMNMFSMPLGGQYTRLGSLDFFTSHQLSFDDMFGSSTKEVNGQGEEARPNAYLPRVNLIAINPPFTRSVGGNLLFGSVPTKRRTAMQTKLKKLVNDNKIQASITAGLDPSLWLWRTRI